MNIFRSHPYLGPQRVLYSDEPICLSVIQLSQLCTYLDVCKDSSGCVDTIMTQEVVVMAGWSFLQAGWGAFKSIQSLYYITSSTWWIIHLANISGVITDFSHKQDAIQWLQIVCCNGLLQPQPTISGHFLHWNLCIFDW